MSYKIIYHFLNGEKKEVVYKNTNKYSKLDFIKQMLRSISGSFQYFGNEDMTNFINLNHVCFFDIEEVKLDEVK